MEILLEKVDEYILIVDYSGKIIFANGKFLKKFGYKKNELCNININEVIANEYLEIGEELNIEPRLRPAKTGSVSQNTSKPIKPRKNNKKFATLMSPTTSSVA